jgi:hypothetical protein
LLTKMPGDYWQRLANLRALLGYQFTRPGKKLVFMGTELAPWGEWNHDAGLPWETAGEPMRGAFLGFVRDLGALYNRYPALWRHDHEPHGFQWIDVGDRDQSIVSYVRRDGDDHVLVVLNLTPVPRERYRVGAPAGCGYVVALSSDESRYGGSGYGNLVAGTRFECGPVAYHGHAHSVELTLPPLGMLVLVSDRTARDAAIGESEEQATEATTTDAGAADTARLDAAHPDSVLPEVVSPNGEAARGGGASVGDASADGVAAEGTAAEGTAADGAAAGRADAPARGAAEPRQAPRTRRASMRGNG